jgi:DNA helicase-2/ATP-dependent DNA helicase PcrA
MDSRDLLAMALEASESALVIPAHIWTPWFSALGANSGFDSIAECYGDLAGHIHAVETGLSSDPPMNWRLSALDRYRLVSNSDAHSPAKLGREATGFDCAPDYRAMHRALRTGHGFGGTIEFFPEEGKYHLDGHRNCAVCLSPDETRRRGGLCPVCGKPLTVGVLNRVTALADRPKGERPARAAPFLSLVPLAEVLGETLGVGPASRKVARAYEAALAAIGPELDILARAPLADISRLVSPALAAAIRHMREGRVLREPGYDGEYGKIRLLAR